MPKRAAKEAQPAPDKPTLALPGKSFQSDIAALQDFLVANSQTSICISASALTRCDSRLLQYLIAATASWHANGLTLELEALPPAIEAHFANLGISSDMIMRKSLS